MSQNQTQNYQILNYLKKGKTITQVEAYHKFGCWRLSARIFDLRKKYDIKTVNVTHNDKTYAQYSLVAK
tara:strand:- start:36 stop:242 length:207 start_codon:yes stop_codon:yes gene_type:complete